MSKLLLVLTALLLTSSNSVHATLPQDHLTLSRPGQLLRLWFSPKHGWRARSYDQRYPGCTRQQIHRVYTADVELLPSIVRNPRNLHWLPDPQEAEKQALYVGLLGLPGGAPSRRAIEASSKDLKQIVEAASRVDRMAKLQVALVDAKPEADFSDVYEQVFGSGSSEQENLAIFDLTVGELQDLPAYKELVLSRAAKDKTSMTHVQNPDLTLPRSADLVRALYAPVDSEQHRVPCEALRPKKYEVEYRQILPVTAGLLYKEYVEHKDPQAYGLHLFWRYVLSGPQELLGIHQVVLNMRCIEACRADARGVLDKLHKPILDDITSWVLAALDVKAEQGLTPALLPVLEDVWGTCPCVLSYEPLVEGVLSKLRKWQACSPMSKGAATQQTVTRLLGLAWPSAVNQALLSHVLVGCQNENSDVRCAAAQGLSKALKAGKLSDVQVRSVIKSLCGLCKDDEARVRSAAAGGFSQALRGKLTDLQEQWVLEALCKLSKNREEYVRSVAAQSVSAALEQELSEVAMGLLIERLKGLSRDEAWHVRSEVARGLIYSCKSSKLVLEILIGLCKDTSWIVRKTAARGLSTALEKNLSDVAIESIVKIFINLSRDAVWNVRKASAEGLSIALIGKLPDTVVAAVVEILRDLCEDRFAQVRFAAAEGFSKAIKPSKLLEDLKSLCRAEKWYIRSAAVQSLSQALEAGLSRVGTASAVEVFISLCSDNNAYVRRTVVSALSATLGKVSKNQDTAVLEALCDLCKDTHGYVREAAVGATRALGRLSEDIQKKLLETLMGLCKDKEAHVRSAAVKGFSTALGQDKLSVSAQKTLVEALMDLRRDKAWHVRQAADQALVALVRNHHQLLVHVLMTFTAHRSQLWDWLSPPQLIKTIVTYSPCLVLPRSCDPDTSRRIKYYFSQERKARGWPLERKALAVFKRPLPSKPRPVYPEVGCRVKAGLPRRSFAGELGQALCQMDKNNQPIQQRQRQPMVALEQVYQEATAWSLRYMMSG